MSDIELVIKLSEKEYNYYRDASNFNAYSKLREIVLNGTPLPEGHGRLKDIDKIIADGVSKGFCDWYDEMKYADTIVEADKESEV